MQKEPFCGLENAKESNCGSLVEQTGKCDYCKILAMDSRRIANKDRHKHRKKHDNVKGRSASAN